MSTRDTILTNLKTALEGITTSNGYHTTVKEVAKGPIANDIKADNCPFVAILQVGEEIAVEDNTHFRFSMPVGLAIYVTGYTVSGMSSTLNDLIDDIKKLIYAPLTLGTHCLRVQLKGLTDVAISDSENQAGALVEINVIYYVAKDAF